MDRDDISNMHICIEYPITAQLQTRVDSSRMNILSHARQTGRSYITGAPKGLPSFGQCQVRSASLAHVDTCLLQWLPFVVSKPLPSTSPNEEGA